LCGNAELYFDRTQMGRDIPGSAVDLAASAGMGQADTSVN